MSSLWEKCLSYQWAYTIGTGEYTLDLTYVPNGERHVSVKVIASYHLARCNNGSIIRKARKKLSLPRDDATQGFQPQFLLVLCKLNTRQGTTGQHWFTFNAVREVAMSTTKLCLFPFGCSSNSLMCTKAGTIKTKKVHINLR